MTYALPLVRLPEVRCLDKCCTVQCECRYYARSKTPREIVAAERKTSHVQSDMDSIMVLVAKSDLWRLS